MSKLSKAAAELFNRPQASPRRWKVGDWMEKYEKIWEIVTVIPTIRPYKEADQTTFTVGYTYGLREVSIKDMR